VVDSEAASSRKGNGKEALLERGYNKNVYQVDVSADIPLTRTGNAREWRLIFLRKACP